MGKNYFSTDGEYINYKFSPTKTKYKIFNNKASIEILPRKIKNGYIFTITIINQQKLPDSDLKTLISNQNKLSLFEVELKCFVDSRKIGKYPSKDDIFLDNEEKELRLRYQDNKIYAVGHGGAVSWKFHKDNIIELKTDFLPKFEVPVSSAKNYGDNEILKFKNLKKLDEKSFINLSNFVKNYMLWIENQSKKANLEKDKITAKNIVKKQKIAAQRMLNSISNLKNNPYSIKAFELMNEAMLMQWIQKDKNNNNFKNDDNYAWRSFQLAFILMTMDSIVNENDEFRDTLDLIWFPTGGGKTEAYLGVMLFLFAYRRLKYPSNGAGVNAIMRYTLRLLSSQQFLRANMAILALELIRQKHSDLLGNTPFSTGLWVGKSSSPNLIKDAIDMVKNKEFENLVISSCPWCGSKFDEKNYEFTDDNFHFKCLNDKCDFFNQILPINVIDEMIYKAPPTLIVSTVDKFANFVWDERPTLFFNENLRPPELIIQDELHLISGALGSIVGLYEAGFESTLINRNIRVKYIASTATIKQANEQIKLLFARENAIFPPVGLRANDSYFAKEIPLSEKSGRLYVGFLAPLLDKNHSLKPIAAANIFASLYLFDDDKYKDCYRTNIVYHNSLKSISSSKTLFNFDVKNFISRMIKEKIFKKITQIDQSLVESTLEDYNKLREFNNPDINAILDKYKEKILNIEEITSNQEASNNSKVFKDLELDDENVIDVALATNMISVGLDVGRLGLMIINGQPGTTAEYIQASSRVGRASTPGIVFTNYHKTEARNISFYENFISYHSNFYTFVEPTSITPFTKQARDRALHAALIFCIRHSNSKFTPNDAPKSIDFNDDEVKSIIKTFIKRIAKTGDSQANNTKKHIEELILMWREKQKEANSLKYKLCYSNTENSTLNLLRDFDDDHKKGLWKTLRSMRNVEKTALIKTSKEKK